MGKLRTDYQNLIDEFDEAMQMDKVYVCREILEHLEEGLKKSSLVKNYFEKNLQKIETVKEDIKNISELLHTLNSEDGWQLASKGSKVTVYFQKNEDSPFLLTKAETNFDASLSELPDLFCNILALFNENDLMPKWFPMGVMESNDLLHQPTKFSKIIQPKIKLQFPINQLIGARETIAVGKGYDMSERRAVAISVNPVEAGYTMGDFVAPETPDGFTRFVMYAAYYFELTETGISFKFLQQLDLKTKMVPPLIMNWLSKGALPNEFIKQIRKRIKNFEGSIWHDRVSADETGVYDEVRGRLVNALEKEFGYTTAMLKQEQEELATERAMKKSKSFLRRSRSRSESGVKRANSKRISRMRSAGKRLSRRLLTSNLTTEKKEDSEEAKQPEEDKVEEPPKERTAADTAMELLSIGIDAVGTVVDLGRRTAVAINPNLKESYPILFKDVNEL